MSKQQIKLTTNFSRGLNKAAPHLIDNEEVQTADNYLFDDNSAYVREGTKVYGSINAPIVALKKFYNKDSSSYFCAFAGGQLHVSHTSGSFVSVSSQTITSGIVGNSIYNDYLYYTTISTVPHYFNGSSIDLVGLSSPIFRRQILDFEENESFVQGGAGSGYYDTNYMRRDLGKRSYRIEFYQPATVATVHVHTPISLEHFATDVSSNDDDLIEIFTVHETKGNISAIELLFETSALIGMAYAGKFLTSMSTWVSCSSDSFAMQHIMPKRLFNLSNVGITYSWSGIHNTYLRMWGTSAGPAKCSFDNLKMINTPPIPTAISTYATSGALFFGSSVVNKKKYVEEGAGTYGPNNQYIPYNDETTQVTQKEQKRGVAFEGLNNMSAPLPSGTYFYKATFVKNGPGNVEIESNPTYQSSGVVISNTTSSWHMVRLTHMPIPPASLGVAARNIYRRRQDETDMRFVYTLHDTSSTTFIDNVPWNALGWILEEDHWTPPQAKYILSASNQKTYFYNIKNEGNNFPSRVRYSKEYEPHYCPLENAFDVSPNDGTEGTGMFEFLNMIYLLKERSTWAIDENNILRNIHSSIGCVAPESIARGENEVFWLGEEGIVKYALKFDNITKKNNRYDAVIKRLPKSYVKNAAGIYYKGFYLLSVTDEGSTVNNLVICYDAINDKFSSFPDMSVNCWTTWQGYKDGYRLFYGNNSGQVCEFLTGNYDISSHIGSKLRCKDFGIPSPTHFPRKAFFYTQNLDDQVRTYEVKPYYDFINSADYDSSVEISGTYNNVKVNFPQRDDSAFFSIEINTSGRHRIFQLDTYGKEEEIR